jgi:hypothetical protein
MDGEEDRGVMVALHLEDGELYFYSEYGNCYFLDAIRKELGHIQVDVPSNLYFTHIQNTLVREMEKTPAVYCSVRISIVDEYIKFITKRLIDLVCLTQAEDTD